MDEKLWIFFDWKRGFEEIAKKESMLKKKEKSLGLLLFHIRLENSRICLVYIFTPNEVGFIDDILKSFLILCKNFAPAENRGTNGNFGFWKTEVLLAFGGGNYNVLGKFVFLILSNRKMLFSFSNKLFHCKHYSL